MLDVPLVTDAYGLGSATGPARYADRGEHGLIWRVDTDRGSWAVKTLFQVVEEARAAEDVAFQRAAAASGIRLPPPVLTRQGTVMLPNPAGGSFRVYEWVDLAKSKPISGHDMGTVLAALHRVRHPATAPVASWFAKPVGAQAWRELSKMSRGTSWEPALETWLAELIHTDDLVEPNDPGQLWTCHRDVNQENLHQAADGGVVVLDWENCGSAEPVRELAMVLADLDVEASRAEMVAANHAYREAGGANPVTQPADFSMVLAFQGHLLRFYADRQANPDETDENRARAERRLHQILVRPLTATVIDDLLAVLR